MGDVEVVRRVRDGDRDAYRVLVDRYAPMVFGIVHRYCGLPSDAEDLAQEIFVRAYEALPEFRGDAAFSSWLYRIALNRCRDHARSVRRDPVTGDEVESAALTASGAGGVGPGNPEAELERSELGRRLREALEELPEEYAVPFLLKYERGLSYKEMGDVLDATVGALKVRVHRARKALRDSLEDLL